MLVYRFKFSDGTYLKKNGGGSLYTRRKEAEAKAKAEAILSNRQVETEVYQLVPIEEYIRLLNIREDF